MRRSLVLLTFVLVFGLAGAASSDVTLAPLFKDGMVLQQGMKCPVWGTAAPGEDVVVEIGGKKFSAKADDKGEWMVRLDAMNPGPALEMSVTGKNAVKISDVLVGEVWVCSGQSNMEFSTRNAVNGPEEVKAADYPGIRLFNVPNRVSDKPEAQCGGRWITCSPTTAAGFTAVGYFFGRELHKQLNVPVGLIQSDWGGTPAEAWTPRTGFQGDPTLKGILERWDKAVADHPDAKKKFDDAMEAWRKDVEKAKAENRKEPPRPGPVQGSWTFSSPTGLYNGMIQPLVPYGIRGAIWYQGEANAGRAEQYQALLSAMIGSWRSAWGEGDFHFGIVQLANFMAVKPDPSDSGWARLREAQAFTAEKVANCGLALAIDIGDAKDIHPKNKQEVGRRLSLWALAKVYGKTVEYSGPVYESMKVEGDKIRIAFTHLGGGLESKGGEPVKGFAIAGDDGKFVWADAKIDGGSVVVSSAQVAKPVAVRYAWADNPVCNLYSKDALPAVPFRTDGR